MQFWPAVLAFVAALTTVLNGTLTHASETRPLGESDTTSLLLITIGPGEELWSSFGHTALAVLRHDPQTGALHSQVYNWGDADFESAAFAWDFLRGEAHFRFGLAGDIQGLVDLYANNLGRTMAQQRFNLDAAQVDAVARKLGALALAPAPAHDYVFHHLRATCTTKVRDFVDQEIAGGAIERRFGDELDPTTPRQYGRRYLAGYLFGELFSDAFMGRLHDVPMTKYAAMSMPDQLAAYLQEVRIEGPSGQRTALLGEPTPMVPLRVTRIGRGDGRTLIYLTWALIALVVVIGLRCLRRGTLEPKRAGRWLLLWAVPTTFYAVCMLFGAVVSNVIEGRVNELMLVFPAADVVLPWVGVRWWRGERYAPRWLRGYAWIRFALAAISVAGHAIGVLFQEPRVLVVLASVCAAGLVVVVQLFAHDAASAVDCRGPSATGVHAKVA